MSASNRPQSPKKSSRNTSRKGKKMPKGEAQHDDVSSSKTLKIVLGILALIVLVLAGIWTYWFLDNYEQVTESKRLPATGEARNNPYYGAELMLRASGMDAESNTTNNRLVSLPSHKDVMVVRNVGATVSAARVDALLDWVRAGGRLVLESHDVIEEEEEWLAECEINGCEEDELEAAQEEASMSEVINNPVLRKLGVYLERIDFDYEDYEDSDEADPKTAEEAVESIQKELDKLIEEAEAAETKAEADKETEGNAETASSETEAPSSDASSDSDEEDDPYYELVDMRVAGSAELKARMNVHYSLVDSLNLAKQTWTQQVTRTNEDGEQELHDVAYLMRIPLGKGHIDVLNDTEFMLSHSYYYRHNSDKSASGDRGVAQIQRYDHAFLVQQLVQGADKVWLLYSTDAVPLPKLLWERGKWAIISFVLLLGVWIWWLYNRFGPGLGAVDAPRRNLLEHLRMAGGFAWRLNKGKDLIADNRQHVLQWIWRKHPRLRTLEKRTQAEEIGEMTGYPVQAIYRALFTDWQGERDFVYFTDLLRKLQQRL